jgi:hypothetical protein
MALLALAALALCGCATRWSGLPPRIAPCPGPIPSVHTLPPGDFVLRERVRYDGTEVSTGFLLVVERRGERLVVVGLNAFGAKAFSVAQQGLEVEDTSHLGRALQVPPRNVLRDLYAARLGQTRAPGRVRVERPECGYTATFVNESHRPGPEELSASPSR